MPRLSLIASLLFALAVRASADELLFTYDADVLPYDPAGGFALFDPCDFQCVETILPNGKLRIEWDHPGGDIVNYDRDIAPIEETPATLWVEWRFRSNIVRPFNDIACDGRAVVQYGEIVDSPRLYGNAVASFGEGIIFSGLPTDTFYTLRFESVDGLNFSFAVDGIKWFEEIDQSNLRPPSIQFGGFGHCTRPAGSIQRNEWDFVRYGTLGDGETIAATDPPTGIVDSDEYPNLDRFIIAFDQPAFVSVDDISVASTGSPVPQVLWVKRLDNGPPETVEIVLDGPLPLNATTTFTLDTGGVPQVVEYTYVLLRACCLPGGSCSAMSEPDCTAGGGEVTPDDADACEGDLDSDGTDGVCGDQCPMDENKTLPGICGCGVADTDSDSDTVADCLDRCPGQDDLLDSDADTIPDCLDQCPGEDDRIDADDNGHPDCAQFQPIPTANAWGLAVLALLILIAAKLRSIRYSLFDIQNSRFSILALLLLIAAKLRSSVFPSRDREGVVTGAAGHSERSEESRARSISCDPEPSSPLNMRGRASA